MKTILIPTDFSADAENALLYAAGLNKKLNAKIILFHSYFAPVPATDLPIAFPADAELKKETEALLRKLKRKFSELYPEMAFEIRARDGHTGDAIVEAESDTKCDLVVMGTRGASHLAGFLVGTNTAAVIGKSVCPVLAVPEHAQMKELHKIVFAANYAADDPKNVFDVIDLARLFDAEVILLHISTGELDKTFEFAAIEEFEKQMATESRYPKISFKLLTANDVFHGMNDYLEEIHADMLAISMRNRTFARKLFSHSLTKKMAYHSHLPVLAFHTSN